MMGLPHQYHQRDVVKLGRVAYKSVYILDQGGFPIEPELFRNGSQ
jgi:hypothetical protein